MKKNEKFINLIAAVLALPSKFKKEPIVHTTIMEVPTEVILNIIENPQSIGGYVPLLAHIDRSGDNLYIAVVYMSKRQTIHIYSKHFKPNGKTYNKCVVAANPFFK